MHARLPRLPRHRGATFAAVAVTAVAGTALALVAAPGSSAAPRAATPRAARAAAGTAPSARGAGGTDKAATYDSRQDPASRKVLGARAAAQSARPSAGVTALRRSLGSQGVLDVDPLTGTPRQVARLDGFLTPTSTASAEDVALGYVRTHLAGFGLTEADLGTLTLRRDYVDVAGTHHLSWSQQAGAVAVFGGGLKAAVTKDGRLVGVQGSPLHAAPSFGTATSLTPQEARRRAAVDAGGTAAPTSARRSADGTTRFGNGDRARLVAFPTAGATRLAWETVTRPGTGKLFLHVLDATSGRVLYRQSLTASDNPTALVHDTYPGAPVGGARRVVDLAAKGWLPPTATTLNGTFARVFTDVNDDDVAQPSEQVRPDPTTSFRFPLRTFNTVVGAPCATAFPCTWNPKVANSWKQNRKQNAAQVFYFVSTFHDHLEAAPIGFTRAAGNFDARDGDAVVAQPDDGANTANGFPDPQHVDNANMSTPPDGLSPTMQMYLFSDPSADGADPFLAANGGDEADVVYHEYTHGLSNRLVVDAEGLTTLTGPQAGAMGEAWSDWYAFDYLVNRGLQKDTAAVGEVRVGQYVGAGQDLIRTEPLDCPVGTTSARCPGTQGAGRGGYTFGDFGKVLGFPEVHADGEIWGQTLWDLRRSLGSSLSESLVTRAMELAPANPSFLDMRNAILQADLVVNGGAAKARIWAVFATRGMGWFASVIDGNDVTTLEDFSLPPAPGSPTGTIQGFVRDDQGAPLAGAVVRIGGHASGFPGDYAAVSRADGRYTIANVFVGRYAGVQASRPGYDAVVVQVPVKASTVSRRNFVLRRDWASFSGGGRVSDTNGPEYADFGCGPDAAIDQGLSGWSTDRKVAAGATAPTAKFLVLTLPAAVDVSQVSVDPTATCGDDVTASAGPFTLEVSADGTTWTALADGAFTPADLGRAKAFAPAAGTANGVRFVRYTMKDSQVKAFKVTCTPTDFAAGCLFIDTTEISVYGRPAA